jgi:hypothetical protein
MAERETLPAIKFVQAAAMLSEKRDSLVARGLVAIQNSKRLDPTTNCDVLYRQARREFDHARIWTEVEEVWGWCEKENPALFAAFEIFQQLASQKFGKAYYPLAILYGGQGISALLEQDEAKLKRYPVGTQYRSAQAREIFFNRPRFLYFAKLAFEWCFANRIHVDLELWCDLGDMYLLGHGVVADDVQAAVWFRKAAEQGHVKAQYKLGCCYEIGCGVPEDDAIAAQWYLKAANQGDAAAQYQMGRLYSLGQGVAQDDAKKLQWFRKAAGQGYPEARESPLRQGGDIWKEVFRRFGIDFEK